MQPGKRLFPDVRDGHFPIFSNIVYTLIRDAISNSTGWQKLGEHNFPTRIYNEGDAKGRIEIKPQALDGLTFVPPDTLNEQEARAWRQVSELDEIDADILDGLYALWLAQVKGPNDAAVGSLKDLLRLRGVKKNLSIKTGRRGGYQQKQRDDVMLRLNHLLDFWVDFGDVEGYEKQDGKRKKKPVRVCIKSRVLIVSDIMGQRRLDGSIELDRFLFQPGKRMATFLLTTGYSTALLSIRALAYNPRTQLWEKRMARYLAWQWRIRAYQGNYHQPFRVRTLLEKGCREQFNSRRKSWQRERFEKMMEMLCDADDPYRPTNGWQYDPASMEDRNGTEREWIDYRVLIEPPDLILSHYQSIQRNGEKLFSPTPKANTLGKRIAEARQKRRLNLICAAEQIGMSISQLSRIETGKHSKSPSKVIAKKIEKWLAQGDQ